MEHISAPMVKIIRRASYVQALNDVRAKLMDNTVHLSGCTLETVNAFIREVEGRLEEKLEIM